ncbi:hypothetical protein COHA_005823 [Chlorella ohadii]|uniref:Ubiquitin-like domain-containing protein n=1 Tax=Chlorella ohadii TaxID=2649997 RepID=A0AAD5DUA2_9CHLO|nr:hypothetical protein COHA_005823 [Chlorella ohadii]
MVAATLNGKACSLELPPECLSVADATSFAKSKLSAAWADTCRGAEGRSVIPFAGRQLSDLGRMHEEGGDQPSQKRLFLSAKGWQPGGTVTVDLPTGRNVELPVCESTCGAHVAAYVAALLACEPAGVRLWHAGGNGMFPKRLGEAEQALPSTRLRAQLAAELGPGLATISVKMLTGKIVTVHLTPDSMVAQLKQAIQDQEGYLPDQQRLVFGARELDDSCTLGCYRLRPDDTVHLVLRLRGGMFALSSGRAGNFEELGLAADEQQVASIAASGRIPVEVVLPDGSSMLLACNEDDGCEEVLAALHERLAAAAGEAAVLAADVDGLQDAAAMRELLRQAQAALRRRQP